MAEGTEGGGATTRNWSVLVGIAFVVVVAVAFANNEFGSEEGGNLGIDDRRGEPLPQFAVPAASSRLEGDANVFQDDCESSVLPCPASDRRKPACEVGGSGVIRVCDFFDRPLVISFWFTRGGDCEVQQDVVNRVARRYEGRVGFLSLDIRDERDEVRRLVSERGWTMPVGHDRDGAVSNLYRVSGCPTFLYALPGGITHRSSIGRLGVRELSKRVDGLIVASRRAAAGR